MSIDKDKKRLHNIPPTDGISKTFFDRQLGAPVQKFRYARTHL